MKKKIFTIIVILFSILGTNSTIALADDDSSIFSLDKDGYWQPSDSVSHDFVLNNIWGEECYLDYLSFSNSHIKDQKTLKSYTVKDAVNEGIIENYTVVVELDDPAQGKMELFKGSLKELDGAKINFTNKIYMKLDSKVTFKISIYFDKNASNEYQNKSYKYVIQPSAYRVVDYPKESIQMYKIDCFTMRLKLLDGYVYGDDGYIYDVHGKKYTETEYLQKISQLDKVSIYFKTGDFNVVLGYVTICLLISSSMIMITVRKKRV